MHNRQMKIPFIIIIIYLSIFCFHFFYDIYGKQITRSQILMWKQKKNLKNTLNRYGLLEIKAVIIVMVIFSWRTVHLKHTSGRLCF